MILVWLILIPAAGGLLAWLLGQRHAARARWISLLALAANLGLALLLWAGYPTATTPTEGPWLADLRLVWIPQLGIGFHLALDGLSLPLVALTGFLGMMAVLASWNEIRERVGFFHLNLMWVLAAMTGVFLALDLFLFFFFWEMMLIPTYFLFLWGHERRIPAAIKFVIFTQAGSLLMLLSILGLYFVHGQATGNYTFDYPQLLGTPVAGLLAVGLMLGFFIAFAVKLPAVPFHTWLPDAYTQAPTGGSVVLAGLMSKTAGYGLIRFAVPLFPGVALDFAPVAMALAVAGILYGALLAFAQSDLKRLVAYSSVSHMGFVLLGVFAWNQWALQGAVMAMVAHGISTGALFILAGQLQERMQTRDMGRMGGLWTTAPRMGGVMLLFALAALGLPGLGTFVGEFLVLLGSYRANLPATVLAAVGIVFATVYALWMLQRTFQGPNTANWRIAGFSRREGAMMAALVATIVWLGLYPQPVLDTAGRALRNLTDSPRPVVGIQYSTPSMPDLPSAHRGGGQ